MRQPLVIEPDGRRWLVTGAAGMLGRDVLTALTAAGIPAHDVVGLARADLDVTDPAAVTAVVREAVGRDDVVVNCAAYTAVDDAEANEAGAFAVNALGPANLAHACEDTGAWLVHVSTDYVFGGGAISGDWSGTPSGPAPYNEGDPVAPTSAYGRTKAAGEWAVRALLPRRHRILRTAWLYGEHGPNFVRTMARLQAERDVVEVVDDQTGQPTWSLDVARRVLEVVSREVPAGTYHATATGRTTWFGLARAVFTLLGADPDRVHPITSQAYSRPAPRPAWSVLGHHAWTGTGLTPLPPWDEALREAASTTDLLGRRRGMSE